MEIDDIVLIFTIVLFVSLTIFQFKSYREDKNDNDRTYGGRGKSA